MAEDKQKICDLLIPVLREMNGFRHILRLEYWGDRGLVYIVSAAGTQIPVDAGKTSVEMIGNIMKTR